ncbi:hypothetical protein CR152_25775 [Massilia violaceinigra]|uniref:Transposase DDE domain-containing protein n=1 Tax=Massilia violaceinigra TaxID=2045208 RepID=A0A2D2DRE5_9BURK|nr:hypothetical protein CR152_25775 [Massilia violaceinigra]
MPRPAAAGVLQPLLRINLLPAADDLRQCVGRPGRGRAAARQAPVRRGERHDHAPRSETDSPPFPDTPILVRGDGHFSEPELMGLIASMPNTDFIFGFSCNVTLHEMAEPTNLRACDLWVAAQTRDVVPGAVRLFDEFAYQARSRPRAWRVLLKAEVRALGENTLRRCLHVSSRHLYPSCAGRYAHRARKAGAVQDGGRRRCRRVAGMAIAGQRLDCQIRLPLHDRLGRRLQFLGRRGRYGQYRSVRLRRYPRPALHSHFVACG